MKFFTATRILTCVSLLFLFGCSIERNASLLSAQKTSKDPATLVLESTPFAYDMTVDTISYNSCVGPSLTSNGTIHGFKLGASEGFVDSTGSGATKAGLKLRTEFLQYVGKQISPNYPNKIIQPEQLKYLLQNSDNNKDLRLQYAVRKTTDLTVLTDLIQPTADSTFVVDRDGVYENSGLSVDPIVGAIVNGVKFAEGGTVLSEGPRIYNAGSKGTPKALEATLGYNANTDETFPIIDGADDNTGAGEQYADQVRQKFNSGSVILALTFGNPNPSVSASGTISASEGMNSPKRKSEADLKHAYGRGFELSFKTMNASHASHRKNIISRVVEKNLDDGSQVLGVNWTCDSFIIMKTSQWNNKNIKEPGCSELTAADLADPAVASRVKLLRRHYPDSNWGIGRKYLANITHSKASRSNEPLCLVNKTVDCYLSTTLAAGDVGVQYDTTKECYLSRYTQMGISYTGSLTGTAAQSLGRCPQYASICYRTSTNY